MTIFSAEVISQMEFDSWVCSIQSNINFCLYDRTKLNQDPDHFNVTEKNFSKDSFAWAKSSENKTMDQLIGKSLKNSTILAKTWDWVRT